MLQDHPAEAAEGAGCNTHAVAARREHLDSRLTLDGGKHLREAPNVCELVVRNCDRVPGAPYHGRDSRNGEYGVQLAQRESREDVTREENDAYQLLTVLPLAPPLAHGEKRVDVSLHQLVTHAFLVTRSRFERVPARFVPSLGGRNKQEIGVRRRAVHGEAVQDSPSNDDGGIIAEHSLSAST